MGSGDSKWIVLKFGGTSVASAENWKNIARVVEQRKSEGFSVCLVHSALSGISDCLEEIIAHAPKNNTGDLVQRVKERHLELGEALDVPTEELLADDFSELEHIVKGMELIGEASYRVQARLLAMGELMATKLGAAYLNRELGGAEWIDARSCIKTIAPKDANERSLILSAISNTDFDEPLEQKLHKAGDLVVTQGFIGSDAEDKTVVLGRGGSDVSAAYFAAKIGAERLEIWTDVPGLFSANPQNVPSARLLNHLSYEEAQEIATNGAEVLHPRSIMPARKHKIPIHVRCTQRPELSGTVISEEGADDEALVKTIAVRNNVILISMDSLGMWQQVGFLAEAFEVFRQYGLSIDLVSTSESNVTVSLDPGLNTHFHDIRSSFVEDLGAYCRVKVIESVSAVSLLGRRIRTILHQLGGAFEVFEEHKVYLVSQAANDLNFTFVVESEQADRLVRQLHDHVITQSGNQASFGLTWPELMEDKKKEGRDVSLWWREKQQQLIDIVEESGPCYVYDTDTLRTYGNLVKGIEPVDRSLYAIKANANPDVLKTFRELGFGFECVSIGEVNHVIELFPDIDRKDILFTPNFAPRTEYAEALELDVNLTLDNIYPLQQWPELFKGQELFLRIDPGHGHGHHKHVKTGGKHSKFGIPRFEIKEVAELVDELDLSIKGLHAHIGSGIKDPFSWKRTAVILHEVAKELGGVEILDLGGGFGIRENETQAHLDIQEVSNSLQKFKEAHPEYELWVEPGRFLVAVAGVLLASVTQLKGKGKVKYVGVDTGMNSFIRPALYGARHTIVNLTRLNEPNSQSVNIVGPICESGDKLGIDRLFPHSEEGDVVLVANTGAYGQVMSSNYNLRAPAKDIVI
ncbi:bifunctional aspartate kinase/diaminopimelate decarboxylase [Aliifodinibius salicampi]|uniref:Diaminopimelate decarboxylase n=1 Tax=Fodinibius salicampi TaxID=1920655 RepID=A0ABT3PXX9_9BACT|nr:bifunctional aspartate kinase/diaminopimelate decarboxylase [Fodinibius salicampi]MCW9712693.1 bifunctional aspartate kinase/diaminopimelate decarboxylase [Fodinibius salicampi]